MSFVTGARALLRGASLIASTPRLWPYAVAPILVAAVAFALGAWGGIALVGSLAHRWLEGWTGAVLGTLRAIAVALAYVSAVVAAAIAAKVVALPIAAGPFNEILSERVEAAATGREPPRRTFGEAVRDALPAAGRGVATALYGLAVLLLFAPLLLIPAVGFVLYLAPSAYVEALGALDVTFGRRRMPLAAKRAWLARRRGTAVGFGAAILVANLIPLGGLLVVPAAAAGGTLLVVGES